MGDRYDYGQWTHTQHNTHTRVLTYSFFVLFFLNPTHSSGCLNHHVLQQTHPMQYAAKTGAEDEREPNRKRKREHFKDLHKAKAP